jgi:hypothetical protein
MLLPLLVTFTAASSPGLRLSDARSLRTSGFAPLLLAHHSAALDSTKLGHTLPSAGLEGMQPCGFNLVRTGDTTLQACPEVGFEWRNPGGEGLYAIDVGGRLQGQTQHMAFWADARMVTAQTSTTGASWDGQYQEFQKDGTNSRLTYTSFSRYEGKLSFESPVGRIGMGRSRQHWGPSYAYPLVLGSAGSPMPQLDWTIAMGDFRVRSLWASLAIDGAGAFRNNKDSRSLYGHRYEWMATNWLTVGASEALILHEREEPAGILPFAPLFMEKGQGLEDDNNGELAFDVEVRPGRGVRLYGEFLIDDVSEPTSLFNDMWKNRWAFTAGGHLARRWSGRDFGGILEYSHVEPWVYAHYTADGVQASHQGFLLGNQSGPNSRSIKATVYGVDGPVHLETSLEWVWKGNDLGSRWTDTLSDNETTKKTFLAGGGDLACRGEIHVGWSWRFVTIWLDLAKQFASADLQQVRPNAPVALRVQAGL